LSSEDWRDWLRRRRWPFWGTYSGDIEEILREIEEMMGPDFKEFSKKIPKELERERVLPDGTKIHEWGPLVYGYTVTIGPDGKPEVREFGNVKPRMERGRPSLDLKGEREPLVDVVDTNGDIKVIVELPGIEKEDIKLHGTEDSLTVSVDTPQRKYYKEIKLPSKVEQRRAKSTYKNGVLETTLPKKEETPKGEPIEID